MDKEKKKKRPTSSLFMENGSPRGESAQFSFFLPSSFLPSFPHSLPSIHSSFISLHNTGVEDIDRVRYDDGGGRGCPVETWSRRCWLLPADPRATHSYSRNQVHNTAGSCMCCVCFLQNHPLSFPFHFISPFFPLTHTHTHIQRDVHKRVGKQLPRQLFPIRTRTRGVMN